MFCCLKLCSNGAINRPKVTANFNQNNIQLDNTFMGKCGGDDGVVTILNE